jgi:type VI secretion system protein ImpL
MLRTWALATLGLAAFAVLVWFGGPLLVFGGNAPLASPQVRVLVVAVFTLQYLAQKLWSAWQARRNNDGVVSGLQPAPQARLPAEAAQLRERFSSALSQLRRARFGAGARSGSSLSWRFGRSYLYQLPWYVIIGAPGAGKTTALLNSGLNFPLAGTLGRGAVRGVGGTRNCDWWFTDRAVLLDTAGRYTTHESDRVADRQAWEVFLKLLRRTRPQRPLNGVLVAVSVDDLLGFTAAELAGHARILRERLEELQSALRVRLPVYVLLTKCDLLAGFVDWFAVFDRKDRDQVWGVTFELRESDSGDAAAQFAPAFDRLVNRLADGLIDRLQAERDPQRRARIFSLPGQLRALSEPLTAMVRGAFAPARAAAGAAPTCLRGVYLTSGTQQGTPIDRMLSAFGRELGLERQILPPNQSTGKSFFLSRLLTEVVFAEAGLSGQTPLRQRWQRRLRLASIVSLQLCAVAVGTWWLSGYARSVDDIARLDDEVSAARSLVDALPARADPDPRALLPALDAMRALAGTRMPPRRAAELLDIGAGARRKAAAAARVAYQRMLLGPFQERIAKALDSTMRAGADVNVQYEALKAYAMLNDPGHFDAAGFKVFVMSYWDSALSPPLGATERTQLADHLDALVDAGAVGSGITLEPALVESVRSRLSAQSPAQRIALRLAVIFDSHPYADFTVASLGQSAAALFVGADGKSAPHAVPGRYTIEAYRGVVIGEVPALAAQLASEASWVLGSAPASGGVAASEFMSSYRGAYAQAWADFVDDLRLKPATANSEAIQQAQALGAPEGPLALALRAIVRQTSAGLRDGADGPIAPSDPLGGRFMALAALVMRDARGAAPLDDALQSFKELQTLRTPRFPGAAPVGTSAARQQLARIIDVAGREPEPVRSMLLALAVVPALSAQPSASSAGALSRQIAARLGAACLRAVAGRFPFDRSAVREATLEDFSRLFAPGGAFDQVFAQLLAPRVDISSDTWRARDPAAGPDAGELERFRAAARLRDVFFAHRGTEPALQLTFRPLDMDQDIDRFELEIDGQTVRYAHGPAVPTTVKWPGAHGSARLEVTPASGSAPLDYSGPWAVFRLFDHVAIQQTDSPARFHVVFEVGGRHASFEVESSSGANPFRLRELEHFDCPIPGGSAG